MDVKQVLQPHQAIDLKNGFICIKFDKNETILIDGHAVSGNDCIVSKQSTIQISTVESKFVGFTDLYGNDATELFYELTDKLDVTTDIKQIDEINNRLDDIREVYDSKLVIRDYPYKIIGDIEVLNSRFIRVQNTKDPHFRVSPFKVMVHRIVNDELSKLAELNGTFIETNEFMFETRFDDYCIFRDIQHIPVSMSFQHYVTQTQDQATAVEREVRAFCRKMVKKYYQRKLVG